MGWVAGGCGERWCQLHMPRSGPAEGLGAGRGGVSSERGGVCARGAGGAVRATDYSEPAGRGWRLAARDAARAGGCVTAPSPSTRAPPQVHRALSPRPRNRTRILRLGRLEHPNAIFCYFQVRKFEFSSIYVHSKSRPRVIHHSEIGLQS